MNILAISSILPIKDIVKSNDFLIQIYLYYKHKFPEDNITIIKPIKLEFNPIKILRKETPFQKVKSDFSGKIGDFEVIIIPFFSSWSLRNLHSILTRSIYVLNRKKINNLIVNKKINLIHAQYLVPDGLLAFYLHRKCNIPYLLTTHNERFYFDHIFSRRIVLKIFKNASRVMPINYSNATYFKEIGLKKINPYPLGFESNFLRKPKKISSDPVKIITVAELIKLKNIDKVIIAISHLIRKYSLTYTIIGQGKEEENLHRLVDNLSLSASVKFIRYIPHDKIADEIYNYDIFIMPSYFETFGRVYLEAMAMGIPIICAKNSGIYGFFRERIEGLSVNHNNIDEIEEALEYLILNPEKRIQMGIEGKNLVQNYTWENVAKNLHTNYSDVIKNFSK